MSQILEENLECLLPRTTYPNLMARNPRLMESFQVREVHPMRKVQGVLTKYSMVGSQKSLQFHYVS